MKPQLQWFLFVSTFASLKWASSEEEVCTVKGVQCISECKYSWSGNWCNIEGYWDYCPGDCVSDSSDTSSTTTSTEADTSSTTSTATTTTTTTTTSFSSTSEQTGESSSGDSDISDDDDSDDDDFDQRVHLRESEYAYIAYPSCEDGCTRDSICIRYLNDTHKEYIKCFCPVLLHSDHNQDCYPQDEVCSKCGNDAGCSLNEETSEYECDCKRGYYGIFCEIPCNDQCHHGGFCDHRTNNKKNEYEYICACVPGWRGEHCDAPEKNCDICTRDDMKIKCFDNQVQHDLCSCLENSRMDNGCGPSRKVCDNCENGANCIRADGDGTYKCDCQSGFYGRYCELSCECYNGGSCNPNNTMDSFDYMCECQPGFFGKNCERTSYPSCDNCNRSTQKCSYYEQLINLGRHELMVDQCSCLADSLSNSNEGCTRKGLASTNCQNQDRGVICEYPTQDTYRCVCPPGYFGPYCESSCHGECNNGGTCVYKNSNGSFYFLCECAPGYHGERCEHDLHCNDCTWETAKSTCYKGVMQDNGVTNHMMDMCVCLEGSTSDNDCFASEEACAKCENQATCYRRRGDIYSCGCQLGFFGKHCKNDCQDRCSNDTKCGFTNRIDHFHYDCFPPVSDNTRIEAPAILFPCDECRRGGFCQAEDFSGLHWCFCPQYSTGDLNCGNRDEVCKYCQHQNEGTTCRAEEYNNSPVKEYTCNCAEGFYGLFCERPCAFHCENGGTCQAKSIVNPTDPEDYVHKFICKCAPGFEGAHCENPITTPPSTTTATSGACSSSPCVGGCTCRESCMREGGYECVGIQGRLGKNCEIPAPAILCEMDRISIQIDEPFFRIEKYAGSQFYLSKSLEYPEKCKVSPVAVPKFGAPARRITLESDNFAKCLVQTFDASTTNFTTLLWSDIESQQIEMPVPIVNFKCNYKTKYTVSTSMRPLVANVATIRRDGARVPLTISLCKQSMCNAACPDNLKVQREATYTIGEVIHVGIAALHPSHMFGDTAVASLKHVYLSCSGDNNSTYNKVEVFSHGCTTQHGNRLSAKPTSGSLRLDHVCFSFRMVRLNQCDLFYIHTHVAICDGDTTVKCSDGSSTCPKSAAGRKRRSTAEDHENKIGPIRVIYPKGRGEVILLETEDGQPAAAVHQAHLQGNNIAKPVPKTDLWWESSWVLIAAGCLFVFALITISSLFFHYTYLRQRNSLSFKH